jgi:hypothetical protein
MHVLEESFVSCLSISRQIDYANIWFFWQAKASGMTVPEEATACARAFQVDGYTAHCEAKGVVRDASLFMHPG